MVVIDIQNMVKRFAPAGGSAQGDRAAVGEGDGVSLRIESGELFFLLGPSGCGKTTLLRMIAGLIGPTRGHILFDGRDMAHVPAHERDTAMVFQGYALWPHMTVAANIGFGLDVRRVKDPERAARIEEVLALVRMADYRDRKPAQLSGGQQQRVALARALAIRPRCLLFDEPLSNLDAQIRLQMRSEIRRIVKGAGAAPGGITSIYVTHDQKEALSMADRIGVMDRGNLVQVGTPGEIYRQPATRFVAGFIGESNFIPGTVQEAADGAALVVTPAGMLRAILSPAGRRFSAGDSVTVAVRPEAIRVNRAGEAGDISTVALRLAGRRVSSTYLGEAAEHLVRLDGDVLLRATEINPRMEGSTASPGDAVEISIDPAQVMLLRE